jgi:DNA polymerase elongation subunit (family B)
MSKSKNNEFVYVVNWSFEEDTYADATILRLYGYDRDQRSTMVKIEDVTTFCYLELPTHYNSVAIKWQNFTTPLLNAITEKFQKKDRPNLYELEYKKKLYNAEYEKISKKQQNPDGIKYQQKLHPYLKLTFSTTSKMKNFISQIRFGFYVSSLGKITVNVFGADNSLTPPLRMICGNDINPVGWVKFSVFEDVKKDVYESTKEREILVPYNNIKKAQEEEVRKLPIIFPSVLSFDIETYSSKLISMPDENNPADVVFQIGITSRSLNGKIEKYLLTLKECDDIEDINVIRCKSERKLLEDFAKLINTLDPDIVIGYNIYGFDYKYIIKRAEVNKCLEKFMKQSCINGRVCKEGKIEWESSAFGIQELFFVEAEGRLAFDMLPYMKRSFKLPNYRLETVCDEFLKTNKDPLKYRDIFECYEKGDGKSMALCGKYCTKDSYVVYLLFEKLNVWYDIAESANTNQVPMFYLYAKGQQIKMYAQVFSYCYNNNIVMNVPRNLKGEKYAGATVLNPVAGIYKNIIPFDFASLYPSIIMAYNIDYTSYITDDKIDDEDCEIMRWNEHVNCEHDPAYKPLRRKKEMTEDDEKKFLVREEKRDEKKICKSFSHKFAKSSAIGKGVIPTILETLLSARKQVRKTLEKLSLEHKLISYFLDKKLTEEHNMDLEKFPETKILMDQNNIEKLKKIQQELDIQKSVLDKRQIAYKVNANSMYGALGAGKGYLPFVFGAMTVTYIGRMSIKKAIDYITTQYDDALVVYGDTDSCFINFKRFEDYGTEKYPEIWKFAEQVVEDIGHVFPSPMKLEFEGKIYATYFILSKKRYIAQPCDINGIMDKKLYKKGVVLQRRDNCKFLKEIYESTLWQMLNNAEKLKFENKTTKQIMENPVVQSTLTQVIDFINKLFYREYGANDFVITKGLNRVDYIGKRKPAHASLAEKLGKRGIQIPVNTRLEYVLVDVDKKDKLQEDIIEEYGYFKENNDLLRIDFFYYLEHQVMKPLDEILKVAFKIENFVKNHVSLRSTKKTIQKDIKTLFYPKFEIDGQIKELELKQHKKKVEKKTEKKEEKNNTIKSLLLSSSPKNNENKKSSIYINACEKENIVIVSIVDHESKNIINNDIIKRINTELLDDIEITIHEDKYYYLTNIKDQRKNKGVLIGLIMVLLMTEQTMYKQILIDDELVFKRWSHGKGKVDLSTKNLLIWCDDLRKTFEEKGGIITKILEDENKGKFH